MLKPLILLGVLVISVLFSACTRKPADPNIARLQKNQATLETEISAIDEQMKTAPTENVNTLGNERELLKSRLERVKEQLKALDPSAAMSAGAPAASGH